MPNNSSLQNIYIKINHFLERNCGKTEKNNHFLFAFILILGCHLLIITLLPTIFFFIAQVNYTEFVINKNNLVMYSGLYLTKPICHYTFGSKVMGIILL